MLIDILTPILFANMYAEDVITIMGQFKVNNSKDSGTQ